MRRLTPEEMSIPSGGAMPGLVCKQTENNSSVSGNTTLTHSTEICQTSSGLTIITTTDSMKVGGDVGVTLAFKQLAGVDIKVSKETTTTDTTVCKPNGECTTTHKEMTSGQKSGDLEDGSDYESFAGGGDSAGCVQIASRLPCGTLAGNIVVGAQMQLSDQASLEAGVGTVSFSKRKKAKGYRLTTASGVTLVCSSTAPIPTTEGLMLAPDVLGKSVAVRKDEGAVTHTAWDAVVSVDGVGEIEVQHITVGDKCFWAGEKPDSYILHHNMKAVDGGGDNYVIGTEWDDWA